MVVMAGVTHARQHIAPHTEEIINTVNLINKPEHAQTVVELKKELQRLMAAADGLPDKMPLDEGIKSSLPSQAIR